MDGAQDTEVSQEFLPLIRIYKSGRVERLKGNDVVPASRDSPSGVSSKDVTISPDVSARLFLPKLVDSAKKLPVLLYIHGGGFVIETPFSPTYHDYVSSLAAAAHVVAVSIHYRLAPEHPLPAAYEDSWTALQWVASHAKGGGPEHWLTDHADFKKIFIAGDSAGGNITHDLATRAGEEGALKAGVVEVVGSILIHPYFWGTHENEPKDVDPKLWAWMKSFWKFVCPNSTGSDDVLTNPLAGGPSRLARLAGKRVLVCLAEKDFLTVWGRMYHDGLASSGYKGTVEILETKEEGHVFHLFNPECENAKVMLKRVVDFINRDD
ncbi:probable carboxylesterase 13 [Aristolochia californica]|uniref:probable carboxylesterase 13 n=1 Tax=Aristolochia californica TaxID=171875 RepID=UPI0035DA7BBE